ncbi:YtxH domain-containing protein [Niabella beijingensis]|uniref:YtxH domain-containing protein n=1 Tax=Niabella beijingensis TaxID=2872700 RepID=UPI001CBC5C66|nr:YtxH domain-containing protein [Niabella beijingensis]MBZ4192207.1 YtxH domain-containing protein [Niabella beijingensis]
MKNRDKYILGIAGAALAGIAIGLLFYTDEGKKTRKKMKNTANDWADSLGSLIASGKESLSDLSHQAMKKAKKGYQKLKGKTEDGYENLKDEYNDLADEYANKVR